MPDADRMGRVTENLPTVSAKIRALDAEGFSRADIARFLGKRYQHVRNVLTQSAPARRFGGVESALMPQESLPERIDVQIGPGGRIVIPAVFRSAMEAKEGDRLMARVVDGELRLITPQMSIRSAQQLVRELIPGDESLVETLFEHRRKEVNELKNG